MPSVTALVDIGTQWAAGVARDVTDIRAALLVNAGWVELTDDAPTEAPNDLITENADPATETKE